MKAKIETIIVKTISFAAKALFVTFTALFAICALFAFASIFNGYGALGVFGTAGAVGCCLMCNDVRRDLR